ncbi:hypothetical protein CHLRE_12g542750v5 [Chlamydomonas reinhardtii]|uniref:Uncharacterized protein n=1 Tax=Chlamydomonas reinhardtii TaxID=3055 RepID=A0A2K3D6R9_CHLRE|nr:uncharacterized protein CHLRE_12g542750v5 [Chlamydomonas reinhardtii]PNW76231.1 hypothetical protein CHLRE_12g542750v5 [Chlamydomonas reinhardtii]
MEDLARVSFGWAARQKPSFDGERSDSLSRISLPGAEVESLDLEQLFDAHWFGPCTWLGSAWASGWSGARDERLPSPVPPTTPAATPAAGAEPPPVAPSSTLSRTSFLYFLSRTHKPATQPNPLQRPLLNGKAGNAAASPSLYGPGAAPTPQPPFRSGSKSSAPAGRTPKESSSPPKAMPVPRRAPNGSAGEGADGDDNNLPVALPVEPAPALPADPSTAVVGPASTTPCANGGTEPMELGPQLGTWANRQFRLLDPVPERPWDGAAGSGSGNSAPSSSSNPRSPMTVGTAAGGAAGSVTGPVPVAGSGSASGSGHCSGQGSGQGSGSSIAAQVPGSGPTLLELLQQQKQRQLVANGCAVVGSGEGRTHGDALLLGVLQQQQQERRQQQGVQQMDPAVAAAAAAAATAALRDAEDSAIQEAAWRWRFTRRWQAEQSRTDADRAGSVNNGDQLEEALAYLAATGATTTTTVSLQIANTSSARGGRRMARNESSGGQGPCGTMSRDGSLVLGQMGSLVGTLGGGPSTLGNADWPLGASGSGSFTSGPRLLGRQPSGEMLQASREVASLNRRAAVVLQQQLDCEQQADRRVQESLAQGPPWVGHYIPVVQIDEWGSFRFLMLKLRDQSMARGTTVGAERQRILIRGHNYGSEGQLMEECNREILGQSQRNNVPFEAPTVMGGGVMEWRRDRDRHLHLHSGFVMDRSLPSAGMLSGLGPTAMGGSGRPASAIDLLNLAAALARQSFPPTYKITVLT